MADCSVWFCTKLGWVKQKINSNKPIQDSSLEQADQHLVVFNAQIIVINLSSE